MKKIFKYLGTLCVALILVLVIKKLNSNSKQQIFEFKFEGVVLNGILNLPKNQEPKGIILLLHGSGRTNAVAQNKYSDVRKIMVDAGYATYMWDKKGCGKSGGTFDINQTINNSALEAIAAINVLKENKIPGYNQIGLYGGSLAGWINPTIINQYEGIAFWISVSGGDDKENFSYHLGENLRIDGVRNDSINLVVNQWLKGIKIAHSGGSYEEYMNATQALQNNKFWSRFVKQNYGELSEEVYTGFQKPLMKRKLDPETGLPINIDNFEELLSSVNIPVLALFGEKDMNIDWRKTKSLYEKTIGVHGDLTVVSFPDCNHSIQECETGGFHEFQDNIFPPERCDGFLSAIENWLKNI